MHDLTETYDNLFGLNYMTIPYTYRKFVDYPGFSSGSPSMWGNCRLEVT